MLISRRTDARRNREAILRVADAALTAGTRVVPLHEIARRTGLGRSTVYRHFPDRHALADAVVAHRLDAMRRVVGAAGAGSFRDLLHSVLEMEAAMRPLVTVLRELPPRHQQRIVDAVIGVLTPSFRRAQAEGLLRADIEPKDLGLVFAMLDGAATEPLPVGGDRDARLQRLITVLLDGLFVPQAAAI